MPDKLSQLLPDWAIQIEKNLDYGVELDEPGLYFTMTPEGLLRAVGVARLSDPPSWSRSKEKIVMCVSVLQIHEDRKSGYSRTRIVGTTYEPDGTRRTANGYSEKDDIARSKLSFRKWASRDIAQKIEQVAEWRESPDFLAWRQN